MKLAYQQQGVTLQPALRQLWTACKEAKTTLRTWNAKVAGKVAAPHALAAQTSTIADAAAGAMC